MIFVTYSFIPPCSCYSLKFAMEIVINMFNADISSSVMGKFSLKYRKLLKKNPNIHVSWNIPEGLMCFVQVEKQSTEILKVQQMLQIPLSFMKSCRQPNTKKKKLFYSEPSKRKEIIVSSWLSILCTLLFGYARKWFYEEFSTNTVESVIIFSSALKFVFPINIK